MKYPYDEQQFGKINELKNKYNKKMDVEDTAKTLQDQGDGEIKSDVNGNYTGMTLDGERPEQDADDL